MPTPYSPTEAVRLTIQLGMMALEAQMVITLRLWGMAGMWNTSATESERMVSEKRMAVLASGRAAGRALAGGASPAGIALAAVKPVRRRTKSNVSRLAQRGSSPSI
ncbi:MAG TPA: antifreeze protein [Paracoccaceae bacterium]